MKGGTNGPSEQVRLRTIPIPPARVEQDAYHGKAGVRHTGNRPHARNARRDPRPPDQAGRCPLGATTCQVRDLRPIGALRPSPPSRFLDVGAHQRLRRRAHYDIAMAMTPYTEWYANGDLRTLHALGEVPPPSTTAAYLRGQVPRTLLAGLKGWDASAWGRRLLRNAGFATWSLSPSHHDGFVCGRSAVANPETGQLDGVAATRLANSPPPSAPLGRLRFGLYYSRRHRLDLHLLRPVKTMADLLGPAPGGRYPAYAEAQTRELIDRYQPSVLWKSTSPGRPARRASSISSRTITARFPTAWSTWTRWRTAPSGPSPLPGAKAARDALDARLKVAIAANPAAFEARLSRPRGPRRATSCTPEYVRFAETQAKKWEATRGMEGHSFKASTNDTESDYASQDTLIADFIGWRFKERQPFRSRTSAPRRREHPGVPGPAPGTPSGPAEGLYQRPRPSTEPALTPGRNPDS